MARPIKQTVDYFPHYCDSSKTIPILESRFGNDGYAFWFKLLELLAKTEGHFYDCNNLNLWEFLLAKTHVNQETADNILGVLANLGKIDKALWENRVIWCQNLIKNLSSVYTRRQAEIPHKPRYDRHKQEAVIVSATDNPSTPEVSTHMNRQSKVKYSKVDIDSIYNLWNLQKIIQHNKLTNDIKRAIEIKLNDYSKSEICQAVKNYAEIVKDEQYYFKYKWTLKDFLKRGLEKFIDLKTAKQNYKADDRLAGKQKATGREDGTSRYQPTN